MIILVILGFIGVLKTSLSIADNVRNKESDVNEDGLEWRKRVLSWQISYTILAIHILVN